MNGSLDLLNQIALANYRGEQRGRPANRAVNADRRVARVQSRAPFLGFLRRVRAAEPAR